MSSRGAYVPAVETEEHTVPDSAENDTHMTVREYRLWVSSFQNQPTDMHKATTLLAASTTVFLKPKCFPQFCEKFSNLRRGMGTRNLYWIGQKYRGQTWDL